MESELVEFCERLLPQTGTETAKELLTLILKQFTDEDKIYSSGIYNEIRKCLEVLK